MKIAITSQGKDLNAEVDPRFGRCQYFIFYDTETGNFENLGNPNFNAGGGAGIQTAQTISEKGAVAVLTGNVGPNAFKTLSAAGVKIYAGVSGSINKVIEQFKSGSLKPYEAPSVESHHGMNAVRPESKADENLVAVTAESEDGLDAQVAQHFGRCPFYTLVTIKNGKIESDRSIANPFFNAHQPGQVPAFINEQNVDMIIAGGMGQRAVQFFNEFGIEPVTGATGTVRETIEAYLNGTLTGTTPCSGGHEDGCDH